MDASLRLGRIKAKGVKQKVRRSMLTGHAEHNEDALPRLHFSFPSHHHPPYYSLLFLEREKLNIPTVYPGSWKIRNETRAADRFSNFTLSIFFHSERGNEMAWLEAISISYLTNELLIGNLLTLLVSMHECVCVCVASERKSGVTPSPAH